MVPTESAEARSAVSCSESERSEPDRPDFHSYQVVQQCQRNGPGVVVHYRASETERPAGLSLGMAYWDFCVSEGQVDKSEQLGWVRQRSHSMNPNNA